jgi:uncharacterized damage-inducible protein DinB
MSVFEVRPAADEHAPFYAGYVAKVPAGNVLESLERQRASLAELLERVPANRVHHRYAPGKWSLMEVVAHMADSERVFGYRALRAARGDRTPLPGFDQDAYVQHARLEGRSFGNVAGEMDYMRRSHILLFTSLGEEELMRRVNASGADVTARALIWIIAGHAMHHEGVLRAKYL